MIKLSKNLYFAEFMNLYTAGCAYRRIYIFLIFIFFLAPALLVVSCAKVDMENNPARLFETGGRAAAEQAADLAWSRYYARDYAGALEGFAAIINSGEEDYIASESANAGLRCGLGYSLLAGGRLDEALYQFGFDSGALVESAAGAAAVHLLRREYESSVAQFKAFDKLFYQASPYKQKFSVCGDINREAHKILFLAYYYMPATAENLGNMKIQYSFIAGKTSEAGISEGADKIFLKIINGAAKIK
jgi:hypothetical protein